MIRKFLTGLLLAGTIATAQAQTPTLETLDMLVDLDQPKLSMLSTKLIECNTIHKVGAVALERLVERDAQKDKGTILLNGGVIVQMNLMSQLNEMEAILAGITLNVMVNKKYITEAESWDMMRAIMNAVEARYTAKYRSVLDTDPTGYAVVGEALKESQKCEASLQALMESYAGSKNPS